MNTSASCPRAASQLPPRAPSPARRSLSRGSLRWYVASDFPTFQGTDSDVQRLFNARARVRRWGWRLVGERRSVGHGTFGTVYAQPRRLEPDGAPTADVALKISEYEAPAEMGATHSAVACYVERLIRSAPADVTRDVEEVEDAIREVGTASMMGLHGVGATVQTDSATVVVGTAEGRCFLYVMFFMDLLDTSVADALRTWNPVLRDAVHRRVKRLVALAAHRRYVLNDIKYANIVINVDEHGNPVLPSARLVDFGGGHADRRWFRRVIAAWNAGPRKSPLDAAQVQTWAGDARRRSRVAAFITTFRLFLHALAVHRTWVLVSEVLCFLEHESRQEWEVAAAYLFHVEETMEFNGFFSVYQGVHGRDATRAFLCKCRDFLGASKDGVRCAFDARGEGCIVRRRPGSTVRHGVDAVRNVLGIHTKC